MNALTPEQYNALRNTMRYSMPQEMGKPDLGKTFDILNRGTVAGTLGGPVDLATMLMAPFGYDIEKPVMGSEWIGDKMQAAGMVSGKRYPVEEMLASFVDPFSGIPAAMGMAKVYHGSPHLFDKFDASKIGSGEGAQAYGHGLYFAESPEVAGTYVQSDRTYNRNSGGLTPLQENISDLMDAGLSRDEIFGRITASGRKIDKGNFDTPYDAFLREYDAVSEMNSGYLYTADIPDEFIPRMLDWDKPLSEQGEEVRFALKRHGIDIEPEQYFDKETADLFSDLFVGGLKAGEVSKKERNPLGKEVYFKVGGEDSGHEILKSLGIPGIRYLDGTSRGNGQGTYNYVVFPGMEEKVQILERNGKPINVLAR
jgi:hypothetical protein